MIDGTFPDKSTSFQVPAEKAEYRGTSKNIFTEPIDR